MNILLFGSTGLVGNEVRREIAALSPSHQVMLVVRKKLNDLMPHETQIVSDLVSHDELKHKLMDFKPEAAFCCIGTTMKKAGSKEAFFLVDHTLIFNAAKASYLAGVKSFGLISSSGAHIQSSFYYLKVKGQMEKALISLGFSRLVILRPGVLLGQRTKSHPMETLSQNLAPLMAKIMIGPFKKYRPIKATTVASALVRHTITKGGKVQIIESQNII